MKFQLAINMERLTPDLDMTDTDVERHTLEMVQMARRRRVRDCVGGPHVPDSARIRLGGGCSGILAPHQGRRRGGAAGSLQSGRASAYQREFDRLHPGLKRTEGHR